VVPVAGLLFVSPL
jgi:hypothetical protein